MSHDRTGGRRANTRAFRPSMDGYRLESRQLLSATVATFTKSQYLLTHPSPNAAKALNSPHHYSNNAPYFNGPVYNHGVADVNTARGGASAIVAAPDGSRFRISLSLADNQYPPGLTNETGGSQNNTIPSTVTQPIGTVRVYAMPGGRVGIIVDGATQYQQLTIDPLPVTQRKGFAHSFGYGEAGRTHVLNIGSLQVNGGSLQAILGFHSADLSGPLTIGSTQTVDRLAFNSLLPGAAIGVGGTLNTLDVANNADLTAGPGVSIARDLNLLNVGGDLTLANGANFVVGRFLGLTPQPPKGTGTGSNVLALNQSLIGTGTSTLASTIASYIQGNLIIGPGSVFKVTSGIANSSSNGGTSASPSPLLINGSLQVLSATQIKIPNLLAGSTFNRPDPNNPGLLVVNNLVARNGIIVNGVVVVSSG